MANSETLGQILMLVFTSRDAKDAVAFFWEFQCGAVIVYNEDKPSWGSTCILHSL